MFEMMRVKMGVSYSCAEEAVGTVFVTKIGVGAASLISHMDITCLASVRIFCVTTISLLLIYICVTMP